MYTAIFHGCKNNKFRLKNCKMFLIFALNKDHGYTEAVLTSTHNLCYRAKISKIMCTSVNPSFTVQKWGVGGSTIYGHVSMIMFSQDTQHT